MNKATVKVVNKHAVVIVVSSVSMAFMNLDAHSTPVQWTVADGGNGHFYDRVDVSTPISWADAKLQAEGLSFMGTAGHLTTFTSLQELDFVETRLFTALPRWLGGYQDRQASDYSEPAGGWKWVTGETWSFTAWSTPTVGGNDVEPNNFGGSEDLLSTETSTFGGHNYLRWNDYGEGVRLNGFYVEYPAPVPEPEPSGLLIAGVALLALVARRCATR